MSESNTPMAVATIRTDAPNTPDDVIDIWLVPHFNRFGWPPTQSNQWQYVLGRGNDLGWLKSLAWTKSTIALSPELLSPKGLETVVTLSRTHLLSETTALSMMSDSYARFRSCCDYLKQHGRFPRPIILGASRDGFDVLDGNHRLTAYFYLYGYFEVEKEETPALNVSERQEVWIASSPTGRMLWNSE